MNISVVIPVYNADRYITKAVESAIALPEVKEIILVEDYSPDNSYQICKQLEKKHPIVKLFRHNDELNHGAGATRNLALSKVTYGYISFLDADDYYLPNRFERTKKTFDNNPDAEGVYEAIGVHFYDENAKKNLNEHYKSLSKGITTVSRKVPPKELHEALICEDNFGWIHLNGLTIKKSILKKVGTFNSDLRISQDTDFINRLAYAANLYPGEIKKPIAVRGIHSDNRITNIQDRFKQSKLFIHSQYQQILKHNYSKKVNRHILINHRIFSNKHFLKLYKNARYKRPIIFIYLFIELINNPLLFKKII
jgi:glycosyltransferase involved in cell wall biosynthesis